MSSIALLLALSAAGGDPAAPPEPAQDKRRRISELMTRADAEKKKGNSAEANRCYAEAWALTAEVYYEEGRITASNEAWAEARRYGWTGEAPAERARRTPTAPPAPPVATPAPRQEEPAPERPIRPYARPKPRDVWPYLALAPYPSPRNNCWTGLLNTPPLEEALVLPPGTWLVRGMVDISSADWSSDDLGGESAFKAAFLTESLQVDYGITDQLLAGLRFATGELGQGGDDPIRVWEDGRQVVPSGDRSFTMEGLVGRVKFTGTAGFADFGVLAEIKVPLADEEDFLTSGSIDVGVSGIVTRRWRGFAVTLNAGVVFPVGDAELFSDHDKLDPYFHGGLAAAVEVHRTLTIMAQFEFNTSPFGELSALEDLRVMVLSAGARYRLTQSAFLSGSIGTGLGEDSGGLLLSSGLDVLF